MNPPRNLPPFPMGWFAIAFSDEALPGSVLTRRFMGQDVVIFRLASGQASVVDPCCPHLGAHLGHGGKVDGEALRCPFHAFRFGPDGQCLSTIYGSKPPPKAKLRTWPVRELDGLLLVYYDPQGQPPPWEIPAADGDALAPLLRREWVISSHPQETTENSVDMGHFAVVHGYTEVVKLSDLQTEGPLLNIRYAMTRRSGLMGQIRTEFEINAYGLGYSLVNIHVLKLDLTGRLWVLATPEDSETIRLRIAFRAQSTGRLASLYPPLALAPRPLLSRLARNFMFDGMAHDVQQDFAIWDHKCYKQPPALAEGDGPIGRYRLWAKQFYRQ